MAVPPKSVATRRREEKVETNRTESCGTPMVTTRKVINNLTHRNLTFGLFGNLYQKIQTGATVWPTAFGKQVNTQIIWAAPQLFSVSRAIIFAQRAIELIWTHAPIMYHGGTSVNHNSATVVCVPERYVSVIMRT